MNEQTFQDIGPLGDQSRPHDSCHLVSIPGFIITISVPASNQWLVIRYQISTRSHFNFLPVCKYRLPPGVVFFEAESFILLCKGSSGPNVGQ
jgi:hypothetical protein